MIKNAILGTSIHPDVPGLNICQQKRHFGKSLTLMNIFGPDIQGKILSINKRMQFKCHNSIQMELKFPAGNLFNTT